MATTGVFALHGTATGTPQTCVLTESRDAVRVINRSSVEIYFTVSGSNVAPAVPAVTGTDSYVVPGVVGAVTAVEAGDPPVNVALVSVSSAPFSVIGGNPGLVIER